MSAEKRLTIWNLPDTDETTENNIENVNEVKSKMMKLIKLAKDGGLEKLRMKSENIDLLQTFVSYCLIHLPHHFIGAIMHVTLLFQKYLLR